MTEYRFSDALHNTATGFIRAMVDVDRGQMAAVPARLITENLDPEKVKSGTNLTALAYGYGVTLWEPDWPEGVKRAWLKAQPDYKARVGTIPAYRMALAASGFDLLDYVRPPGGTYAMPTPTVEEENAWLRRMPEIRIKYRQRVGLIRDETFADDAFASVDYAIPDEGRALSGRQAIIRYPDGHEDDLVFYDRESSLPGLEGPTYEMVAIPHHDAASTFASETFADVDFALADDADQWIVSLDVKGAYDRASAALGMTAVYPGLAPLRPYFEQESDIRFDNLEPYATFAGDAVFDVDYCMPDEGADMLADRVWLYDPKIGFLSAYGFSFANVDRVGVPQAYVEVLVDVHGTVPEQAICQDDNFVDVDYAFPTDTSREEKAMRAVAASKALRDTVMISFETRKPLEFSDTILEATRADEWVEARL